MGSWNFLYSLANVQDTFQKSFVIIGGVYMYLPKQQNKKCLLFIFRDHSQHQILEIKRYIWVFKAVSNKKTKTNTKTRKNLSSFLSSKNQDAKHVFIFTWPKCNSTVPEFLLMSGWRRDSGFDIACTFDSWF